MPTTSTTRRMSASRVLEAVVAELVAGDDGRRERRRLEALRVLAALEDVFDELRSRLVAVRDALEDLADG